jgi:hypothetical protein
MWREQARADWDLFIRLRSKELATGGSLVLSNLFMDADGYYTTKELGHTMDCVIAEMVLRGIVTEGQSMNFTHPSYFRTKEEYLEPLERHSLKLQDCYSRYVPNPLYIEYVASGDPVAFGVSMAEWCKQWTTVALNRVLDSANMDARQRAEASSFFFTRLAELIAQAPDNYKVGMVMLYLHVSKTATPGNATD